MEEAKKTAVEIMKEGYDTSLRPFDFVEANEQTAMICESDPVIRNKIKEVLTGLGYRTIEPATAKDAIGNMRFHVFDLVILSDTFNAGNNDSNDLLYYLSNLNMSMRRQIFVTLISDKYRTSDNMVAFCQSVNLVINTNDITDDIGQLIKRAITENEAFYYVFKEMMKKKGRV